MQNLVDNFDSFNPYEFKCNYCNKTHVFTQEEIDRKKQKVPGSEDCFIICESCKKGHMQPPELVMSFNPTTFTKKNEKTGRNAMCLCGSGKKYKRCCGNFGRKIFNK